MVRGAACRYSLGFLCFRFKRWGWRVVLSTRSTICGCKDFVCSLVFELVATIVTAGAQQGRQNNYNEKMRVSRQNNSQSMHLTLPPPSRSIVGMWRTRG
jgi:hypothetical protein